MSDSAWDILGIEPGSDERTIKRAYAARLKQTNPEDDADGFKALRSAYESALSSARFLARYGDFEEENEAGDTRTEHVEPPPKIPQREEHAQAPRAPEPQIAAAPTPEELHERLKNDLAYAIYAKATPFEIQACLENVLGSPRMDDITAFTATENFLVDLIEDERPASEILIKRCVSFFRWDQTKNHYSYAAGQRAMEVLKHIEQEREGIEFLALLQNKKHYLHPFLFEATTDPDTRSWLSRMLGLRHLRQVRLCFDHLYTNCPSAFERLNPKAVAWLKYRVEHILPLFENWRSVLIISGVIIVAAFLAFR